MIYNNVVHTIEPVYDDKSKILILGSFPSVKSRENEFFYAHPQNRFWRVLAGICGCVCPTTNADKKQMLLSNGIALWDVIHSCDISGSADSTIKNVVPNDLSMILSRANIKQIFVNGKKAQALYNKYIENEIGMKSIVLPSTSPANAAWSYEKLFEFWNENLKPFL
jgi:hypoxanthine-DNA glycosylase